jgi:hypothetical protein
MNVWNHAIAIPFQVLKDDVHDSQRILRDITTVKEESDKTLLGRRVLVGIARAMRYRS